MDRFIGYLIVFGFALLILWAIFVYVVLPLLPTGLGGWLALLAICVVDVCVAVVIISRYESGERDGE